MDRREFIRLTGLGAAALFVPAAFFSSCRKNEMMEEKPVNIIEGKFNAQLPFPSAVMGTSSPVLQSGSAVAEIMSNKSSRVFGYHNNILGPIIKATTGETVNPILQNALHEETNIHWHGLVIPADMDGHPENIVNAGSSFNFSFVINQRAGTYWYHPHTHGKTARQVFMGLAGMFIVNDNEEQSLELPSGSYEVPLIIQDKCINPDFSLNYSPTGSEIMTGYLGQFVLVNGKHSPFLNVATRYYRLRVLNGSTARIYNLALSNGSSFYVIGSDGGLLSIPEPVTSLVLAPGERADLLIDFSAYSVGTELYLQSNAFNGGAAQGNQSFKILKLVVDRTETDSFALPATLSVINPIPPTSAVRTRKFNIVGQAAAHEGMPGMENMKGMHRINDKVFDMDRIDETVNAGTTEIWEFDNSTGDELHPMHIHGVQFQVVERTGGRNTLIASERGWKDTVLLMAGEKVKVIMTFPSNTGKFVFHCHNLEHEDDGMMLNYAIV
jgi:blue copper oxidase